MGPVERSGMTVKSLLRQGKWPKVRDILIRDLPLLWGRDGGVTWGDCEGLERAAEGAEVGAELPAGGGHTCQLRHAALPPNDLLQLLGQATPPADLRIWLRRRDRRFCMAHVVWRDVWATVSPASRQTHVAAVHPGIRTWCEQFFDTPGPESGMEGTALTAHVDIGYLESV